MRYATRRGDPPDTKRAKTGSEWPFIAFVLGLFIMIVLRSLVS
jgi:hypothetical protein